MTVTAPPRPRSPRRPPESPAPPREGLPPGPGGPPALQTLRWLRQPIELMDDCRRSYGDVFMLRLINERRLVVTSTPAIVRALFTGAPDVLPAAASNS